MIVKCSIRLATGHAASSPLFQLKLEETSLKEELTRLRDEYEALKKGIGLLGNDKLLADYAHTLMAIDQHFARSTRTFGNLNKNRIDTISTGFLSVANGRRT